MASNSFLTPGVAVVIGAASGIGKATAIAFARNGARAMFLADSNEPGVEMTARLVEQQATHQDFAVMTWHVDVRDYASVTDVFHGAVKCFGRIDYSVTTAGIQEDHGFLADNPLDVYDKMQDVNAKGVLHHTKAAIRVMLKQERLVTTGAGRPRVIGRGAIVNVCSMAGLVAFPSSIEYTASKFAAVGITKTAANEYGGSQIRINAVCPGGIETPLLHRAFHRVPGTREALTKAHTLNRLGIAEEVADAILFLTSNAGSFVHGSSMTVDGGFVNNGPL